VEKDIVKANMAVCTTCGHPLERCDPKIYKEFLIDKASQRIYEASFQLKGLAEEAALARAMIGNHLKSISNCEDLIDGLRAEITVKGSEDAETVRNKLKLIVEIGRTIKRMDEIQDRLNQTLDLVGRLVERDQKIKASMRLVLDARTALLLLQHMSTIVNSICRDCDKRDAIADELEHLDLIKDVPYEIVEEDKDEDSK
jgi:hypothetical protein